jgi:hypothetical protein
VWQPQVLQVLVLTWQQTPFWNYSGGWFLCNNHDFCKCWFLCGNTYIFSLVLFFAATKNPPFKWKKDPVWKINHVHAFHEPMEVVLKKIIFKHHGSLLKQALAFEHHKWPLLTSCDQVSYSQFKTNHQLLVTRISVTLVENYYEIAHSLFILELILSTWNHIMTPVNKTHMADFALR